MKRKYILIIVIVVILLCFFFLSNKKNVDICNYYPETQTFLYDLNRKDIEDIIGIKENWIKEEHVMVSILEDYPECVLVFHYHKQYENKIKTSIKNYIRKLKTEYNNSLVSNYKEYQNDEYYIVVISDKAKEILNAYKEEFSL